MKLLTDEIKKAATEQYLLGSSFEQNVIAKFFDPCSSWSWYLMNVDPDDPTGYAWGIVSGSEVEAGSFSIDELESIKRPFGLGIERDLHFKPRPASHVWDALNDGEYV